MGVDGEGDWSFCIDGVNDVGRSTVNCWVSSMRAVFAVGW